MRCAPPANRPIGAEIRACRSFLTDEMVRAPAPAVVLCLGRIAHEAVLRALGLRPAAHAFRHGAVHRIKPGPTLVASYRTSRYNLNTGVLTEAMFDEVLQTVRALVPVRASA